MSRESEPGLGCSENWWVPSGSLFSGSVKEFQEGFRGVGDFKGAFPGGFVFIYFFWWGVEGA